MDPVMSISQDEPRFSDEDIVRVYQDDPHAETSRDLISDLFEEHYSRVSGWCYRFTGDRERALDLTQDVFLLAFRKIHTFRSECKFSSWLYRIARNRWLNEKKDFFCDDRRRVELSRVRDCSADPHRYLEQRRREELAEQLLRTSLTAKECSVMTLHFVQEIPLDAVSDLLHLENASGARAFLVSAKRKLARAVERSKYGSLTRVAGENAGGFMRRASAA